MSAPIRPSELRPGQVIELEEISSGHENSDFQWVSYEVIASRTSNRKTKYAVKKPSGAGGVKEIDLDQIGARTDGEDREGGALYWGSFNDYINDASEAAGGGISSGYGTALSVSERGSLSETVSITTGKGGKGSGLSGQQLSLKGKGKGKGGKGNDQGRIRDVRESVINQHKNNLRETYGDRLQKKVLRGDRQLRMYYMNDVRPAGYKTSQPKLTARVSAINAKFSPIPIENIPEIELEKVGIEGY